MPQEESGDIGVGIVRRDVPSPHSLLNLFLIVLGFLHGNLQWLCDYLQCSTGKASSFKNHQY